MGCQHLRELAHRGDYGRLVQVAQAVAEGNRYGEFDQALASVLWGYALLRIDSHRYHEQALCIGAEGAGRLQERRADSPDDADWALLTWAFCQQFVDNHAEAERIFRTVLAQPDVSISNRLVAVANLAHSLNMLDRKEEALEVFQTAGRDIDALPADQCTPFVHRERQRIRLNLADYYLAIPDPARAEAELEAADHGDLTPLMTASYLVSRARVAMMRDQWEEAEALANQANAGALQVGYIPLRLDALGVLVAVAGRRGRTAMQQQLVSEMASLMPITKQGEGE